MSSLTLPEGIVCLENALKAAQGHLDEDLLDAGTDLLTKVRARRAEGTEHTLVAFAGATGSGKSSLLNAVVGENLAHVAARRPTTAAPFAVSGVPAPGLTHWLGIEQSAVASSLPSTPDSQLVLVDLPDIDSTQYGHREIARKVLERADLIVWIVDPQKYADSVWHDDYLGRFTEHGRTSLIAFNQIDRVEAHELPGVLHHLDELLALESFHAQVIPTSAVTGQGIRTLQEAIGQVHDTKQAANRRLAADLRAYADGLGQAVESEDGSLRRPAPLGPFDDVAAALLESSGSNQLAEAAATSYTHRGQRKVAWLGTAWLHRGHDPLAEDADVEQKLVPHAQQTALARARIHRYSSDACANLPRRWRRDVVASSEQRAGELASQTASLVSKTDLGRKTPAWWMLAKIFQWIAGAAAVAGLAWLLVLWVTAAFHIQFPEPVALGPVALPTVLLVGGLVLGWLGALTGRALLARGARRVATRVHEGVGRELTKKADTEVLTPLKVNVENYAAFVENVQSVKELDV